MPDNDWQIPLQSLPRVFGTRLETIPAKVPYVFRAHRNESLFLEKPAGRFIEAGRWVLFGRVAV